MKTPMCVIIVTNNNSSGEVGVARVPSTSIYMISFNPWEFYLWSKFKGALLCSRRDK